MTFTISHCQLIFSYTIYSFTLSQMGLRIPWDVRLQLENNVIGRKVVYWPQGQDRPTYVVEHVYVAYHPAVPPIYTNSNGKDVRHPMNLIGRVLTMDHNVYPQRLLITAFLLQLDSSGVNTVTYKDNGLVCSAKRGLKLNYSAVNTR